ncbi:MAG: citryl-CoA lyase [Labilithrix sp.]|nr:citryl-CoA lyase [Labilithrix sp.]MCW5814252.1 citryl-CoA lyase [Labilithrix sp.]
MSERPVTTSIATHDAKDITIRGKSLCEDLIGKLTFTEMTYFHVVGRVPTKAEAAVLDACLVTLMEHGLTPSVLATRLVASSAPEALQSAVAAGLLAVGSVFVGTVEGAAALVARVAAGEDPARIAKEHRAAKRPLPGFGHPEHKPDDPRPPRIFAVLDAHGLPKKHVDALLALGRAVDAEYGKHITINATGAVAAALLDVGVPAEIMRGFAVLARCAGLVGHVLEEMRAPAMGAIWDAAEKAVPYAEP